MKPLAQRCLKIPLLLPGLLSGPARPGFNFLIYHSVSNRLRLELDLPFALFQRQLVYLARRQQVIGYDQALAQLRAGQAPPQDQFVLTFDDGFVDFYSHVFPLLRRLALPATLFVTTGFVESGQPYPLLPRRPPGVRPVTWPMLDEMVRSGLVTLGAHTHTHPNLVGQPEVRLREELVRPIELIHDRLGVTVRHFAYPRARWDERVEALVAQYYVSAVVGGGQKATAAGFKPHRIPRLPIRRSDGWLFFRAKIRGWLRAEESVYGRLRQLKRLPAQVR